MTGYRLHFLCSECELTYPTGINMQFPDDNLAGKSLAEVTTEDNIGSNIKALMERTDLGCWKNHPAHPTLQTLILAEPFAITSV